MSNHQKEAKLKASTVDFVEPLLKRLKFAKEQVPENSETLEIFDQISTDVINTKTILNSRENWDTEIIGYFEKIERQIDYLIDHKDHKMTEWNECPITNLKNIRKQLPQDLRVNPSKTGPNKSHEKESYLAHKAPITDVGESSNNNSPENEVSVDVRRFMGSLNDQKMYCLEILTLFPENTKVKKRLVIYLWIGILGTEQLGEIFFSFLVENGILIPVRRKHNQVIYRFTLKPAIRKKLISDPDNRFRTRDEGPWGLYYDFARNIILINLNHMYIKSSVLIQFMSELCDHDWHMVHLGSWRYIETKVNNEVEKTGSEETKLKDHIELDNIDFFHKLGELVTYISLRGISGIKELPYSIGKLENLLILDLRACHNLEKLPDKPRSRLRQKLIKWKLLQESWFKNLMVLDISECYLLDHMPKWVCELSNLEVLKGFVVGSVGNKNQSCRLGDLSKLNKLRKLSIRIATDILSMEDSNGLKYLDNLLVLTIIWGANSDNNMKITTDPLVLPKNLEKLDIRCYPKVVASELLNPAKLKKLKRLYIRGGKLTKIRIDASWEVEILRLRFLKYFEMDSYELERSFKNLKYVECEECPMLKNFPRIVYSW